MIRASAQSRDFEMLDWAIECFADDGARVGRHFSPPARISVTA